MNRSSSSDHRRSKSPEEPPPFLPDEEPGFPGAQRLPRGVEWRKYKPTEEENEVFRQCGTECFFYRSLPMALAGMTIVPFLFPKGSRLASSRVGLMPEILLFGALGYIAGLESYMDVCKKKLMNLENSPIGQSLRNPSFYYIGQKSELSEDKPQPVSIQSDTWTKSQNTQSSDRPPSKVKRNKYGDEVE